MRKNNPFFHKLLLTLLALLAPVAFADTVKLKTGETYEGKITSAESSDIVRIEVQITASIKETKVFSKSEVAEIIKTAPDDAAFAELQNMVPTRSLMSAESYKTMLETSIKPFLAKFPDSKHKTKVEEMKTTLDSELDKVERGHKKLEETWYTPQDQQEYAAQFQSRILLLQMKAATKQNNYNGFISSLRAFGTLEKEFYGTPAFAEGVELAKQVLPTLGRQLQGMYRDVEYRNKKWETDKAALDENSRAQVEAARAQEEARYQAGLAVDKKAGIKWVRLNPNSKASIESYLSMVKAGITSLNQYDVAKLKAQAEKFVEVDKLASEGRLTLAEAKLNDANAMSVAAEGDGSKKKTSRRSTKGGKGSYPALLREKINLRKAKQAATEKALKEAEESEELNKNLQAAKDGKVFDVKAGEGEMKEEKPDPSVNAFAALADVKKEEPKKDVEKSKSTKKPKKKTTSSADRPRPVVDSGGGIGFSTIMMILTGLVIIAVIVMKVLGIGGAKEE